MNECLTLNVEEAARQLGVSVKSVYDLAHRQDFPTVRIGRKILISREGLREWVLQQAQNGRRGA